MKKNNPNLWSSVWSNFGFKDHLFQLKRTQNSILWQKIEKIILDYFGSFENLRIIEIGGGGSSANVVLCGLQGAKVSILNYSLKALENSKKFLNKHNVKADFILQDALKIDASLKNSFDVVMSFGLAEHFKGESRKKIIKAHFDLLKKGGIAFIAVPNKYHPLYQFYKLIARIFGAWGFGEEYAFSRRELKKLSKDYCKGLFENKKDPLLKGSSIFPKHALISAFYPKNLFYRLIGKKKSRELKDIVKERENPLQEYFGYSLMLVGIKK